MNKIIVAVSIFIVWSLSGFYSFELMKGDTIVSSIQVWEFYKNPLGDLKFLLIHLFLSLIIGTIIGLSISFLLRSNTESDDKQKHSSADN